MTVIKGLGFFVKSTSSDEEFASFMPSALPLSASQYSAFYPHESENDAYIMRKIRNIDSLVSLHSSAIVSTGGEETGNEEGEEVRMD